MSGEEFVIAVVAIACGTAVISVTVAKVTGLIKAWINRNQNGYDEETFNRLAKAFMQHKKDTERRLQNLEAIVTADDSIPAGTDSKNLGEPQRTIEIEDEDSTRDSTTESGNLRNMLRK